MLVEINLLPKKEPKKYGFIILSSLLVILILLASAFYYYQIHTTNLKIQNVDKQMSILRKISEQQSEKLNKNEAASSLNLLNSGIEWAEANRVITIPVMKKLTSLLPERGFIQSFKYEESEIITLKVQFDTTSEAAFYLDRLNKEKWIRESTLIKLNAESENEAEGNSVPKNSSETAVQSNFDTEADTNGSSSKTSEILPRYIGEFHVELDIGELNKMLKDKKDATNEEGVISP
jgi:hypothetical protein